MHFLWRDCGSGDFGESGQMGRAILSFEPRGRSIYSHGGKEVITMLRRRLLVTSLVMMLLAAFALSVLAQEAGKGKIESLDKGAKKNSIAKAGYTLSDGAAKANVKAGDEVKAAVGGW